MNLLNVNGAAAYKVKSKKAKGKKAMAQQSGEPYSTANRIPWQRVVSIVNGAAASCQRLKNKVSKEEFRSQESSVGASPCGRPYVGQPRGVARTGVRSKDSGQLFTAYILTSEFRILTPEPYSRALQPSEPHTMATSGFHSANRISWQRVVSIVLRKKERTKKECHLASRITFEPYSRALQHSEPHTMATSGFHSANRIPWQRVVSILLLIICFILASPAWAKSSKSRRNPSESSSTVSSSKSRRNPPEIQAAGSRFHYSSSTVSEKQGLGIRDQGLGKTSSDGTPNPYPPSLTVPRTAYHGNEWFPLTPSSEEEDSGRAIDSDYQPPQRSVTDDDAPSQDKRQDAASTIKPQRSVTDDDAPSPLPLSPGGRGQGEGRSFESVDLLKEKLNEKQVSGIRDQGLGKTSSDGTLTPNFYPPSLTVPRTAYHGNEWFPLSPSSPTNSGVSMLKAALSLALVLALIWVMSYLVKKYYLKGNLLGGKLIRTLDTCSLGPKGSLALVQVEDQTLLLGITSQEITLLAQLNLPDKSMLEKSKMEAAENKQSIYPHPANRSARSDRPAQSSNTSGRMPIPQSSSATGASNLPLEPWTSLDGEENNVLDDFAKQLSLHSLRFQPPEPPYVQEISTNSIAGILESRFKGLKKI